MFEKVKNAVKKFGRWFAFGTGAGATIIGGQFGLSRVSDQGTLEAMPVINSTEIDTVLIENWKPHEIIRMSLESGNTWALIAIRNDSLWGAVKGTANIAYDMRFKCTPNKR